MIRQGQMNSGNLAHNGSFVVILPVGENGAEVGVKLQWGDFDKECVADMRVVISDPHIATMLLVQGWVVGPVEEVIFSGMKPRHYDNVATIPTDVEIYVMPEQDSYWRANENGGLIEKMPVQRSSGYPAEGKLFKALYVRAFAMGIWKNSQYTRINRLHAYPDSWPIPR